MFSPHTWGWTADYEWYVDNVLVFPTHVGMDLLARTIRSIVVCFPHTRGDGPEIRPYFDNDKKFSPHTWGWTFEHISALRPAKFSPHTWGWT